MEASIIAALAQYTPNAIVAIVLVYVFVRFFSDWSQKEAQRAKEREERDASKEAAIIAVVQNNTEALTRLCTSSAQTNVDLREHDQRAQGIDQKVTRIGEATGRIEQGVSRLLDERGPKNRG